MRSTLLLIFCAVFFVQAAQSQTFNGAGGAIPDSGAAPVYFPINVSGIGNINSSFGLSSVCVNINHSWISDIEIYLRSPDGMLVPLSIQNGGSGDNYTGTCFSATASTAISDGMAPFTGEYIPDGYMGGVNNGQDANGIWNLVLKDMAPGFTGSLVSWSLHFSNAVPGSPPACNGNLPPGNTCADATSVCSFNGFCSRTSSAYTADSWMELDTTFCGTVQNNAFVKFVATDTYMNFSIWVTSSTNHDGIQMFFYDGGCGSGAITEYGCYSPIRPGASPTIISATELTPGNTYYLMIDGYAGDECDYIMQPFPLENALAVTAAPLSVCAGKSAQLTATGGNGIYSWSGAGLNTNSGDTVTATPPAVTTYSVSSIDPGGICPVTKQVTVTVRDLPEPPVVSPAAVYCQKALALPLTATGTTLLWYNAAAGGIGSIQPIIPSTLLAGNSVYYVSQTAGCESPRAAINVTVLNAPELGAAKEDTICTGKAIDLTREFNINNLDSKWTFNGAATHPPHAANIAGIYQLEVTNDNGCRDTAFIHLNVQPLLHVFAGNDTVAVKGLPQQLHCSDAATYSWLPAALLNFSNIQDPVATLTSDQQFIVQATDIAGCTGFDTVLIKVYPGPAYYIPNAFTPNGDGLNDLFKPFPVGIVHTEYCRVINRYGKIIFDSKDLSKGWDGTYLNAPQPAGSYVWFIKGIDKTGKPVEMKGTVVLIR